MATRQTTWVSLALLSWSCDDDRSGDEDIATDTGPPAWLDDGDGDGDGWSPVGGDCDDAHPGVNPAAEDLPDDGVDRDCDGSDRPARRPESSWTDDGPPQQEIGLALAIGADVDHDGQIELTVGAPSVWGDPYGVPHLGNVYQFEGAALSTPMAQWYGSAAGAIPNGLFVAFGLAVAAGGDTDGDGYGEVLATSKWRTPDTSSTPSRSRMWTETASTRF